MRRRRADSLKQTTVLEFQRAVVSRVEPILASGKAVVDHHRQSRPLNRTTRIFFAQMEACTSNFETLQVEFHSIECTIDHSQ